MIELKYFILFKLFYYYVQCLNTVAYVDLEYNKIPTMLRD